MSFVPQSIPTKPFPGQKPGTSGLRKKVVEFQQKNYTENFIQCVIDGGLGDKKRGATLVVGGDGRYLCPEAINLIIKIAAANGIGKLIVGKNGILSTPAVSNLIRKYHTDGGIILTASHNPGGPKNDFGIKFNCSNGGPAPDNVTNEIYNLANKITKYEICSDLQVDFGVIGTNTHVIEGFGNFTVQVIDSVEDYVQLMKEIFDFNAIKTYLSTGVNVLVDSLHGVTGPYATRILIDELGCNESSVLNAIPKPDFGGGHPDPNLTYAAGLVGVMKNGTYDIGAAFDGDGDRNMILGKHGFFVTPSDSLAVIANNLECIPYFQKTGVKGYARSMPTGMAVDLVGKAKGLNVYEVPTGWKYFGNLMDAGKISICGEESFGTGSDHIREKDGIWAFLAWLQILAFLKKPVEEIIKEHWQTFGRNVFLRYDYENVEAQGANLLMTFLQPQLLVLPGSEIESNGKKFMVTKGDNFNYTDPVDGSVANNQGSRIFFADGSRIVFRLSGTGSAGATIRLYAEYYIPKDDTENLYKNAQDLLKPLALAALDVCKMEQFTGRKEPTVIT
uniref:phosphoglucomutase (alpha-D-glucose-1,6-bisphosphate-dependent) n=1 Tax=Parastrongyloides trichosuri TaxID=131310 RepID=A0A0N5A3L7_PARTI